MAGGGVFIPAAFRTASVRTVRNSAKSQIQSAYAEVGGTGAAGCLYPAGTHTALPKIAVLAICLSNYSGGLLIFGHL